MDCRQNSATLELGKLVVVPPPENVTQTDSHHHDDYLPEERVSRVLSCMVPGEAVKFFSSEFHRSAGQRWFDVGRTLHIRHRIPRGSEVLIIESVSIQQLSD